MVIEVLASVTSSIFELQTIAVATTTVEVADETIPTSVPSKRLVRERTSNRLKTLRTEPVSCIIFFFRRYGHCLCLD